MINRWSDGLGNPTSNSLPLCQLLELRNILLASRADIPNARSWIFGGIKNLILAFTTSPKRIYFWMDTLCVPLDPEARKLAIRKLTDCYKNAALILARDSFMMRCSSSAPADEILHRLNLSTWVRRMWTFQEAVHARRIHLQLSDGYERLFHIPSRFNVSRTEYKHAVVTPDVKKTQLLLSLTIVNLQLELLSAPRRLFAVALALAMRRTSKPTDEAISVATLLDRGIDEVLSVHGKQRWLALLPALRDLMSPAVIFMRGPKMSSPGYRWAPSTFLDLDQENELAYLTRREGSDDSPLSISDSGLKVSFPGLLFGPIPKPLTPVFCFESKATNERFWATTGIRPDGTASWDIEHPPAGIGYGLVMQKVPGDRSATRAVLLANSSVEDGVIYGSYVCVLNIERMLQQSDSPPQVNERIVWGMITSIPDFKEKCWFPDIQEEFSTQMWCVS
jgi:hypothetical protein